jgi:hypothetical protein
MRAYNVPDYAQESRAVSRILTFHPASIIAGAGLFLAAIFYKKVLSAVPDGLPWYFAFLVVVGITPAMGLLHSTRRFINWRAFSFTCFLMLLVSLLWEVTLGVPYGWWGYQRDAMMGIFIGPWHDLPIEAACVWFAVTFTTVIIYEAGKIWQASGKGFREAMMGVRSEK